MGGIRGGRWNGNLGNQSCQAVDREASQIGNHRNPTLPEAVDARDGISREGGSLCQCLRFVALVQKACEEGASTEVGHNFA